MPEIRRQATLFLRRVPAIETIRRTLNPRQAELISAHVTLCREDEVTNWDTLAERLKDVHFSVKLEFGSPIRDGNLVFLPGVDIEESFFDLRQKLLLSGSLRDHKPHLTLIHPRNGLCTDDSWATIQTSIEPFAYTFNEVSFIIQKDGGVWQTIRNFPLKREIFDS